MQNQFIFIKLIRRADQTVFAVQEGQKKYFDPIFKKYLPYSSGQQIKRSVLEQLTTILNEQQAPTTFVWTVDVDKFSEGEVLSVCDPTYADQLLGGWMSIPQGGTVKTLSRRSPLSFSVLRPLHPLLSTVQNRECITFDRTQNPEHHEIIVREKTAKGNRVLEGEEVNKLLQTSNRSLLRKWIPEDKNPRASGIFVEDIAIDLRRLFTVSDSTKEPEISAETRIRLKQEGWIESKNVFGSCLVCPPERRAELIKALAKSLLNWRITSNQSTKYSPQDTIAVAISTDASRLSGAIRAKITDAKATNVELVITDEIPGTEVYQTLTAEEYILTDKGTYDALEKAEASLVQLMEAYDYSEVAFA